MASRPQIKTPSGSTKRPVSPTLNPNAQEFVPAAFSLPPAHHSSTMATPAEPDSMDTEQQTIQHQVAMMSKTVGVVLPDADVAAIRAIRSGLPEGKRIKYSIKQLLAMKPLDPHAEEFTPLWMQGIHSARDFEQVAHTEEHQPYSFHHRRSHHTHRAHKRQKTTPLSPTCAPRAVSRTHTKDHPVMPKA